MARLGTGVAVALLAVAVGTGVQAHALGAPRTIWERAHSSQLLAQAQAGKRSALVIGNGAYTEERLANAVNDAEAVARTLEMIGFSVTLVLNADKRAIDEAVEAFSRRLGPGEIGLFYFSGHGVQVDGESYLVPINAQLRFQRDTQYDAVPLGKVIIAVETTRASAKIIIIDACRNNPFYRSWRSTTRGGATRGLATPLSSGDSGTLIAFATAPGKEAADGIGSSPHSPFTTYLLRHLRTPNLEVGQLFRRVRGDVMQATGKQQIPWVSEALIGDVFLNQRAPGVAAVVADGSDTSRQQPAASPRLQPQPEPQPAPQRQAAESLGIQRQFNASLQPETESQELSLLTKSLSNRNHHDADIETKRLLLSADAANNVLSKKAIGSISCERLRRIDEQWTSYTKGVHGFSAQLARFPGSFSDFEAIVGWRRGGFLTKTTDQGKSQPPGYFPRAVSNGPIHEELLQRFHSCQR